MVGGPFAALRDSSWEGTTREWQESRLLDRANPTGTWGVVRVSMATLGTGAFVRGSIHQDKLPGESCFKEIPLCRAAEQLDGDIICSFQSDQEDDRGERALERCHQAVSSPVETVGKAKDSTEPADEHLVLGSKAGKVLMLVLGQRLAVIAGDSCDELALPRGEAEQIRVADKVVGVLVMARIAYQVADIMEQCSCFQQLPILFFEVE